MTTNQIGDVVRVGEHVDAVPVEESAAVAHWHRKATDAEAALAAVTADRDALHAEISDAFELPRGISPAPGEMVRVCEMYREIIARQTVSDAALARVTAERDHWLGKATELHDGIARVTIERDAARTERDGFVAVLADRGMCSTCEAIHDALWSEAHRERGVLEMVDALRADAVRLTAERDEARAKLATAIDTHFVHMRRLTVEKEAAVGAGIAECERREKAEQRAAAVATICEALGMGEADDRTPAEAVQYIVSLRRQLATWQDEGVALYAALDLRDAQEGDRIAAWAEASGLRVCERCWYPCCDPRADMLAHPDGTPMSLCDACLDDDERASAEEGER